MQGWVIPENRGIISRARFSGFKTARYQDGREKDKWTYF